MRPGNKLLSARAGVLHANTPGFTSLGCLRTVFGFRDFSGFTIAINIID